MLQPRPIEFDLRRPFLGTDAIAHGLRVKSLGVVYDVS
jgi:hypothetical protein